MRKKYRSKNKESGINYLEKKPVRNQSIGWKADDEGIVSLEKENTGLANFLAQKILFKPRISYIHLDKMGSFIWQSIDGETNLITLGEKVKEKFGQESEPLYERLAKYIQILESYGFITLN